MAFFAIYMARARKGSSSFLRTLHAMASSTYTRDEILNLIDTWSESGSEGMPDQEEDALNFDLVGSSR